MNTLLRYWLLTTTLSAWFTFSQAQVFKGGQGDGFDFFMFESGTSAEAVSNFVHFVVSPNPVKCNEIVQIHFSGIPSREISIRVYTADGSFVKKEQFTDEKCSLSVQNPGIYFLSIQLKNCLLTNKIIVLP